MPVYGHFCEQCGNTFDDQRAIADAYRNPACPACGAADCPQDLAGKRVGGQVSRERWACEGGAMPHEMARAIYDGKGNYHVREKDGSLRQLNAPGEVLHPKTGDVLVRSTREYHQVLARRGMVDARDFGGRRAVKDDRKRKRDALMDRAKKREQAAAKLGRQLGWVKS